MQNPLRVRLCHSWDVNPLLLRSPRFGVIYPSNPGTRVSFSGG